MSSLAEAIMTTPKKESLKNVVWSSFKIEVGAESFAFL